VTDGNSRYASSSDGGSFFERLFGGGRPTPPVQVAPPPRTRTYRALN
jgi:hypothetical protein